MEDEIAMIESQMIIDNFDAQINNYTFALDDYIRKIDDYAQVFCHDVNALQSAEDAYDPKYLPMNRNMKMNIIVHVEILDNVLKQLKWLNTVVFEENIESLNNKISKLAFNATTVNYYVKREIASYRKSLIDKHHDYSNIETRFTIFKDNLISYYDSL